MHLLIRAAAAGACLVFLPAAASADIVLKNRDGRTYEVAVRHSVATTTTSVPARSYLIVTEGAESLQLRDGAGNPKGEVVTVSDGDRLEVKDGKLVKTAPSDTAGR